jgi:hypothetical protein
MKVVKTFVKTCYSESLVASSTSTIKEQDQDEDRDSKTIDENQPAYHTGLGHRFRFPGDPKK